MTDEELQTASDILERHRKDGLSVRSRNAIIEIMMNYGMTEVKQIASLPSGEIAKARNAGKKSWAEIIRFLEAEKIPHNLDDLREGALERTQTERAIRYHEDCLRKLREKLKTLT